jgi:hypothetical protein
MLEFFFPLLVQIEQRKTSKAPKNRFSKKWKENTFFKCSSPLPFGSSRVDSNNNNLVFHHTDTHMPQGETRHPVSRRSPSSHTRRTTSSRYLPLVPRYNPSLDTLMTVGRLIFTLSETNRSPRHLCSVFYDYPSDEIHTHRSNPFFTSSIFRIFDSPRLTHIHPRPFRSGYHGESLGLDTRLATHVSSFP